MPKKDRMDHQKFIQWLKHARAKLQLKRAGQDQHQMLQTNTYAHTHTPIHQLSVCLPMLSRMFGGVGQVQGCTCVEAGDAMM